jgi:hypothetical protein
MGSRGYTPIAIRREVELQQHLCAYCLLPFGTVTRHHGTNVTQKPQGDHFEPWALNQATKVVNLAAACQICNHVKRDQVFESFETAQKQIQATRYARGYRVLFIPNHPITEDAWRWASEYAVWLID